ncbi:MAG: 2-amino-4-hydroxy-6-hydroxymethyldihydropteridine diphosphokinase [Acidobacteriota bacterium]
MGGIFLGLGSNLGARRGQILRALHGLEQPDVRVLRVSAFYETEPLGPVRQPDFMNLVCQVATELLPEKLFGRCQAVEKEMGRVGRERWGPRPIDIDILYYGRNIIELPDLTIPHPRLRERKFVLVPLAEIAPAFRHPGSDQTVEELLDCCPDRSRVRRVPGGGRVLARIAHEEL